MNIHPKLEFYCPRWGCEMMPWEAFMSGVKNSGYDGIEYGIPRDTTREELDKVWNLADQFQLKIIPHHYDTVTRNFSAHKQELLDWFKLVSDYPAEKINMQTGRDCFSWDENEAIFRLSEAYQNSSKVQIIHETHRQRCLFSAHTTRLALEKIPNLKITLDISHWICVAENFLSDQSDATDIAIARTEHIHARVGHPQGPQVNDPRAPEWKYVVDIHLDWWKAAAKNFKRTGRTLTITPEFGPTPYMPCSPWTAQPCASQWEVNLYMMNMLRESL